jgi:hypothetical protein
VSNSLNALFHPSKELYKAQEVHKESQTIVTTIDHQTPEKGSQRFRKERADKKKDIKFPVSPEQREELRRIAKDMRLKERDPSRKYETISNTHVLKKALDQQNIFPERYPPLVYQDTLQYMHVEPILRDFEHIEELSIVWNLSLRKTVYRLIMNFIFRGEVDSNAYRAGR